MLPLQLEASHNEALTTSKAHSQEVAKMQVRAAKQPPWAMQDCVAHFGAAMCSVVLGAESIALSRASSVRPSCRTHSET